MHGAVVKKIGSLGKNLEIETITREIKRNSLKTNRYVNRIDTCKN